MRQSLKRSGSIGADESADGGTIADSRHGALPTKVSFAIKPSSRRRRCTVRGLPPAAPRSYRIPIPPRRKRSPVHVAAKLCREALYGHVSSPIVAHFRPSVGIYVDEILDLLEDG